MILNISGRCDICAFFSEWLMNRFKEGFVDVRNPFYPKQVSRILLDEQHIDAIIFCTKNMIPIMQYLDELSKFPCVFQISLTPYRKDIEPNVIDKRVLIENIIQLSKKIGKDKVIVRYDPILLNDVYTIDYHIQMFTRLCTQLQGYVQCIITSFIDMKKNTKYHAKEFGFRELTEREVHTLAEAMGKIAKEHKMQIQTCAESYQLDKYGFSNRPCISPELMYQLTGKLKKYAQSQNRDACRCLQNVDIGYYNLCTHFCRYCYANYDEKQVHINMQQHDPKSTMLVGHLKEDDILKIREK